MRSIRLMGSLLVRSRTSHWPPCSKACSPSAPQTPLHLRVLVHLSAFQVLRRKFICGSELLVSLIFLSAADIGVVVSGVWENILGLSAVLDGRSLAQGVRCK